LRRYDQKLTQEKLAMSYKIIETLIDPDALFYQTTDGVLVYGVDYEQNKHGAPQYFASFPASDPRALFEAFKPYAVPFGQGGLIVDLVIDGDTQDHFLISYQSVDLLRRDYKKRMHSQKSPKDRFRIVD
jgi:hypothetical protein